MNPTQRIAALQQTVRESRLGIAKEYEGLMEDLDVQKRFQNSFRHHPVRWISGAAVAGLLTTLIRFKGSPQERGKISKTMTQGNQRNPADPGSQTSFPGPLSSGIPQTSGWMPGVIQVGKLLFPILQPIIMEWIGSAAQSALARKSRNF